MDKQFHITLLRHGETLSNRNNIMQGQKDTKLSDLGEQQALLAALSMQDVHFTYMVSSDLARAADTARAVVTANKVAKCQLDLDKRLRERGFGVLEDRPYSEFQKVLRESSANPHTFTPEGGETLEQVVSRAKEFFHDLCKKMLILEQSKSDSVIDNGSTNGNSVRVEDSSQHSAQEREPLSISVTDSHTNSQLLDNDEPMSSTCVDGYRSLQTLASTSTETGEKAVDTDHVLIVSHGLLLRELKKIILSYFHGILEGANAKKAHCISPNTGVSRFTMRVWENQGSVEVQCLLCHYIDDTSHLQTSKEDLLTKVLGAV